MTYPQETKRWRAIHEEAGERLHANRGDFFIQNHREIVRRLQLGHTKALRAIAREIRAAGIYSRKTALCQVEHMLMCRLYRLRRQQSSWTEFVRTTVGLGWLGEERRAA
jgi:hypothetical protein